MRVAAWTFFAFSTGFFQLRNNKFPKMMTNNRTTSRKKLDPKKAVSRAEKRKSAKKRTRHFRPEKMRIRVRADAFGNEFVFRRVKIPERDFHAASFFFYLPFLRFSILFFSLLEIKFLESELDYWKISFFDQTFFLCRRPTLKGCRHFGRRRPFFGRGHCAHAHFEGRKCRVRFFALLRFSARKTAFFGSSFCSNILKINLFISKKVVLLNWKCEKSSRLIFIFVFIF